MGRSKTSGTFRGKDGWRVDKVWHGDRIQKGGFGDQGAAEDWLVDELARRNAIEVPAGEVPTFETAAAHYLKKHRKKLSIETEVHLLEAVMPHVGHLPVDEVYDEPLEPFVKQRQAEEIKSKTINLSLAMVRRVLNYCAESWRGADKKPMLKTAPPKLTFLPLDDQTEPMQLTWDGQRKLLPALPDHLARMALFDLNTGARDDVLCSLEWEWELKLQDFGFSVFVVPKEHVKGRKRDRVLVCNSVAQSIIESVRGQHPKYVFVYSAIRAEGKEPKYRPIWTMNNTGWQNARAEVGLDAFRVHDMRHTVGMRLREAGVAEETRDAILWHVRKGMTQHYAIAQLVEIHDALELISKEREGSNVSLTTLIQMSRVPSGVPSVEGERKTA